MIGSVVLWLVVSGVGLLLLLSAQPIGRPRPTIARGLAALRPDQPRKEPVARLFGFEGLDPILVPALKTIGGGFLAIAVRFGLDPRVTARRLRAAGEPYCPAVFWGQKIAGLAVGLVLPPVLEAAGVGPDAGWPRALSTRSRTASTAMLPKPGSNVPHETCFSSQDRRT